MKNTFDYIIAGGGISGSLLAYELIRSPINFSSLLIIEKEKEPRKKHISFWAEHEDSLTKMALHSWSKIRIHTQNSSVILPLNKYRFYLHRSDILLNHISEELIHDSRVTWKHENVVSLQNTTVTTKQNTYVGDKVFSSIPARDVMPKQVLHGKGIVIRTKDEVFIPDEAIFFDFRLPTDNPHSFFYVLPFSTTEALVELAIISPFSDVQFPISSMPYNTMLDRYCREILKTGTYTITHEEVGVIPLSEPPEKREHTHKNYLLGAAGGMVKRSTSFGYTRILKDIRAIIKGLTLKNTPSFYSAPIFYEYLDIIMAKVIHNKPELLPELFASLFSQKNDGDLILGYLNEDNTLFENAKLFSGASPLPLLKGLLLC